MDIKKSEYDEQCALIDWARSLEPKYPELRLLMAYPSGELRPDQYRVDPKTGKKVRYSVVGQKLQRMGVLKNVPDLFLAKTICDTTDTILYPGLFIEMKSKTGRLREGQKEFMELLREQGFRCEVCYSFEEARDVICDYLGIEEV